MYLFHQVIKFIQNKVLKDMRELTQQLLQRNEQSEKNKKPRIKVI